MADIIEYPFNLLYEIMGEDFEHPADVEGSLEYVIATELMERERRCVSMRYRNGMTYEQIAKAEHITRERIRQIVARALRKLRHPSRAKYLKKGVAAMLLEQQQLSLKEEIYELKKLIGESAPHIVEKISDRERQKKDNTPIEHLDLSVRSYNCLRRAGINTLGDIAKLSCMELTRIRNLGKRSWDEINKMLIQNGYPPKAEVLT